MTDSAPHSHRPVLTLAGVRKHFGGVRALQDACLELRAGSVTALLGENGAGKSTLVKILTGVLQPDVGEIRLDGRAVRIPSPGAALQLGISAIHQESVVFGALSVAENICINARPRRRVLFGASWIDWPEMRRRARALLRELEIDLDPDQPLRELTIAQKHLVQIARALHGAHRIVIMDEPTAALSRRETEDLFGIVRRLRDQGRAVLFIGHKFDEIFALADRYAIFRDGSTIEQGALCDTTQERLIAGMVGRAVEQRFPAPDPQPGPELLRVEALSRPPFFRDVGFSVRRGEILGFYGLVGAGRSELMQTLFGLHVAGAGEIFLDGKAVTLRSPEAAIRHGLALVPEDRQHQGAILDLAITDNISLPILHRLGRRGFIRRRRERRAAQPLLRHLHIKAAGPQQRVRELSGGNQQKVVLAKWLATRPRLLILDEPTKGIDIGAKAAVYRLIRELADQGIAILLVSSELPEVLGLSNRVAVMRHGRVCAVFEHGQAQPEQVMRAATGAGEYA